MQPLVTALGPVVFLCLLRPPAAYLLPLSISRAVSSLSLHCWLSYCLGVGWSFETQCYVFRQK